MGIHDFTDVSPPTKIVGFKDLAGKRIAVDTYVEAFRTSGIQHQTGLTNPAGEPTQHIQSILSNVIKMESLGIKTWWCIDSREPPMEKKDELDKRKREKEEQKVRHQELKTEIEKLETIASKMTQAELQTIDPEWDKTMEAKRLKLKVYESRFHDTKKFNKYIEDILFILTKLGIRYTVAPPHVEAEQLAAYLCRLDICDGVMTTDTDAMAFGAPWMIKKIPKKSGKYEFLDRAECLKIWGSEDRMLKGSVMLGCDYAEKTKGVGPKTVLSKIDHVDLTDKQKEAVAFFKRPVRFTPQIVHTKRTKESIEELRRWLIDVQGFNEKRLDTLFELLSLPSDGNPTTKDTDKS